MSDQGAPASAKRRGRPPGDTGEDTRRRIVDAARELFVANGFATTSMRAIARAADVDPALLRRYFSSKDDLFLAAHRIPDDPRALVGEAVEAPALERGRVLTRAFLGRFLTGSPVALSLIRSAAQEEAAAALLRSTIEQALIENSDALADGPEAHLRVAVVSAYLVGVVFHRCIIAVAPLDTCDLDDLVDVIAPAVQITLTPARGRGVIV